MSRKSRARKSWRQKMENPPEGLPKVVDVTAKLEKRFGGRYVLVPTPLDTNAVIRKVPKGKLISVNQIRAILAKKFKADSTCPMTVGIFLRIISEFAEEQRQEGKKRITPYWRVVKTDGGLNPKFPGGVKAQAARLRVEGHKIVAGKGKGASRVKDFQNSLV